ncbi:hypothetical protein SAMN04488511_102271 [Pedobacter suwonensis]|uniref:Dolichyl-phosphate-mannose-protein mannosyltransferase n=1 Tax=Pedobacter suwonensis TaxID=332999 RepID=A0A1I0SP26_9SPHI|nr:hypothetical protein SAMN04488511_102271 [Pedobacter suwonensis]
MSHHSMLLIKTRYLYIFLGLFCILSFVIINVNRAGFSKVSITSPHSEHKSVGLPFSSSAAGEGGIYVYTLKFFKTRLFNGTLHIIPDDCIEEIVINGKYVPPLLFSKHSCDNRNGTYLNVGSFTTLGINTITLKVRNNQGLYGLNILDTTFYDGYFLLFIFVFFLFFVRYKYLWKSTSNCFHAFCAKNKVIIRVCFLQILVLSSSILLERYVKDTGLLRWILVNQLILIVAVPIIVSVYRNFLFGKTTAGMFLIAFLICLKYLYKLFYDQFSYDVDGHVEYIQYLIERGRAPLPSGGWVFYHPSFYYRSAAFYFNALDIHDRFNYEEFLKIIQSLSLCIFMVYCFFSVKTIDLIFRNQLKNNTELKSKINLCYLATVGIFLYWSSNPMFSVRIGNDILFDLLFSMSFYFLVKWWFNPKARYFTLTLFLAALDVWTKSNGLILFGVIGTCLFGKIILEERLKYYLSTVTLFMLCMTITVFLSFHHKIERLNTDPNARILVDNANAIGSEMHVESSFSNFLTFNPIEFIDIPFTNTLDDSKGRQNFWFFLFKTSLFSEFPYKYPALTLLAKIISFLFLMLLIYSLWGLAAALKRLRYYLPVLIAIGAMIGSMILFRIYYPFSCSNDFRYIYPAVLPFACLVGTAMLFSLSKSRFLFSSTCFVILAFLISSGLFQIINILTL